jgi:hypothetical protein
MQQFEIIIKNEKTRFYNKIALINLLLNFILFFFLLFYDEFQLIGLSSILALGLYLLLRWYVLKKQQATQFFDEFVFFIPAMCWFGFRSYALMIILVILGFLFKFSMQKIRFVFTRQNVMKTNFPKKEYDWNLFSNVMLRDNILTLDFKNNKLIQVEIEDPEKINSVDFNEFAESKINRKENILSS